MFAMGAINNLVGTEMAVQGAIGMGYPESSVLYLGIVSLVFTALYAFPKTSVLGAALLTAWLGGAVATHYIHHDPVTMMIGPAFFGSLVWVSIWLRNDKLKQVFPMER